ncbi:hypothetical protein AD948_13600 [Acetobacter senegalensis]|uniref:Methionine gamma-lyase n=1 Tax=Acetobacter senegalensis TaxID=446692 RepID=A0A149TX98_9PROT|nr:aminotransferase class I/II-fold pyridoxal phosphate-dependent enzyme [Acetobacter senegalensis]KXV57791.1 hypothetical protein AD948_13600 [Acetobacter senegalensis]
MPKTIRAPYLNAVVPPISVSSAYYFRDTEEFRRYKAGEISGGRYGRYDNPSWLQTEAELAQLEGTEAALLFPSGMSAVANTVSALCKQGDRILYTGCAYRNLRTFFNEQMSQYGVESCAICQADIEEFNEEFKKQYDNRCRIVFVEMPSNPHMYLVDLEYIKSVIDPSKTLLIVDSTFASPINCQPTKFGADLVVHSCTKYLGGHGDLLAGCVCGSMQLIDPIRNYRNISGAVCDGFTAFLLSRSLETLGVRMEKLNRTGLTVAKALEKNPIVSRVYYTGLSKHPHASLASRYLSGHGGVIAFELGCSAEEAEKFIDRLEVPFMGTNFGSHHAMVEQCAEFTYYKLSGAERSEMGISDTLIRYTVGLHTPDVVIDDLVRSLRSISLQIQDNRRKSPVVHV